MQRLAFALGLFTVGLCVATSARADFAVIRFNSGYCRIWIDTAAGPQDGQFVVFRVHHHQPAVRPLQWAVSRHVCRAN
jgi:hypothetical protein